MLSNVRALHYRQTDRQTDRGDHTHYHAAFIVVTNAEVVVGY